MFPSDLWVTDPNAGKLFKVENDMVTMSIQTPKNPRSVLVSQDMLYVYTVNWDENTVSQYRQGTLVRDIKVGNIPYAICEDGNGYIYVSLLIAVTRSLLLAILMTVSLRLSTTPWLTVSRPVMLRKH